MLFLVNLFVTHQYDQLGYFEMLCSKWKLVYCSSHIPNTKWQLPCKFQLYFALCMKKPNQSSHLHICPTFQYSSHCHCFAHRHVHSLDRHLADTTHILALVLIHLTLWHVPLAVTMDILTPSLYIGSIKIHVHQSSSCMYLYHTFRTTFMPS
jgi:hypothetical protein